MIDGDGLELGHRFRIGLACSFRVGGENKRRPRREVAVLGIRLRHCGKGIQDPVGGKGIRDSVDGKGTRDLVGGKRSGIRWARGDLAGGSLALACLRLSRCMPCAAHAMRCTRYALHTLCAAHAMRCTRYALHAMRCTCYALHTLCAAHAMRCTCYALHMLCAATCLTR